MGQIIFLNNNAFLQNDSATIHSAGTVLSWFEENKGELLASSLASTITRFEHQ
jgi:hypothetical protein